MASLAFFCSIILLTSLSNRSSWHCGLCWDLRLRYVFGKFQSLISRCLFFGDLLRNAVVVILWLAQYLHTYVFSELLLRFLLLHSFIMCLRAEISSQTSKLGSLSFVFIGTEIFDCVRPVNRCVALSPASVAHCIHLGMSALIPSHTT